MKRISLLFSALLFVCLTAFSQNDNIILKIGENEFTEGEFWHVYNKNKHLPNFTETPKEFAERFIDYKVKVVEAKNQGLDTTTTFKEEFGRYAEDLKASYLIDSAALENKARQAYQHMKEVVNASHILIRLEENATPSDTLKAWTKLHDLRERVVKGEDFNELAVRYSEDPSAVNNQGKLGYFSAFRMVYPFEQAAFSTSVGEVSEIIRTNFGYHILAVHERMPNPGRMQAAHIMKMFPQNASDDIKEKMKLEIDSIYQVLLEGGGFEQLAAQHSDDANSANKGGEMRPFTLQEMVPEFAFAAFKLENDGDISKPIMTDFGWHIIKRIEHTPVGDFASNRSTIMNMMRRDGRDQSGEISFVQQKRESDNFYLNQNILNDIEKIAEGHSANQTFFEAFDYSDEILFSYYDKKMTFSDFMEKLKLNKLFDIRTGFQSIINALDKEIYQAIITIEKRDMARNNPQYRYLINEYHDGLLIFEISNNEVWQGIGSDTIALQNHYKNNIEEFSTPYKLDGVICELNNRRLVRRVKRSLNQQGSDFLVQILKDNSRTQNCYRCEEGSFVFIADATNPIEAGQLPVDNVFSNAKGEVFWHGEVLEPAPIPYHEIIGHVMSSFQRYKEKQWVATLREKHQPEFDYNLLNK